MIFVLDQPVEPIHRQGCANRLQDVSTVIPTILQDLCDALNTSQAAMHRNWRI